MKQVLGKNTVSTDSLHVIEGDTDAFKGTLQACQETTAAIIGKHMEEPWVCLETTSGSKNFDRADSVYLRDKTHAMRTFTYQNRDK